MQTKAFALFLLAAVLLTGCVANPSAPGDPYGAYQEGRSLYDRGLYSEAVAAFDEALSLDPGYIDAWLWQGKAYGRLGATDRAMSAYQRVLNIRPDHAEANYALGLISYERRQYPAAEQHLRRALATDAGNADAYFYLASIHHRQGQCREPREFYQKALSIQPAHYDARQGLTALERENCRVARAPRPPRYEKRDEFSGGGRALSEGEW